MEKFLIFAVDLGHFKAYRITKDPLEASPRIKLIESFDSIEGRKKVSETLSDVPGRFGRGGKKVEAVMGAGERHTMEMEKEKRLVKMIAREIEALVAKEKCREWHMAAGKNINSQIIENLPPGVKERLGKNVTADLTSKGKSEILGYFP